MPVTNTKEKTFYPLNCFLCCCPSGPLMIDASTKVRGFAPGQTIYIKIDVFNESKEHVNSLEVKLNKVSRWMLLSTKRTCVKKNFSSSTI